MIHLAFIKFGGMASGGIEKYLQTLAVYLPKDQFEVDYYYTPGAKLIGNSFVHPDTDPSRVKFMADHKINSIFVNVQAREDRGGPPYPWLGTDFWDKFDQSKYDIVQTGRCGYPEFPFNEMHNSVFVDSIHSCGELGIEKRDNIKKTVLLSRSQADKWLAHGGDASKLVIIPPLIVFPDRSEIEAHGDLRTRLGISPDTVLFGMHQRNCDEIFSPIPLEAYRIAQGDNTAFAIMGGSEQYRQQANALGLRNVHFVPFSGEASIINNFISALDVFAHGRRDGEVCSAALIEAMYHGKPILSHPAFNMGHAEQIEGCGLMCHSVEEYADHMRLLRDRKPVREALSKSARLKYESRFSFDCAIADYVNVYKEIA